MIRAFIFDLDGTLVQTEKLKAISYARAAQELSPGRVSESQVTEAYEEFVGGSREEVGQALMRRLGLEEAARQRADEMGVEAPWQAFVQVRLRIYNEMLADEELLRESRRPQVIALLKGARERGCEVALTTMSDRRQTERILAAIGLAGEFAFVATADDIERGKPDPEIYELAIGNLKLRPAECLAIEDSGKGVRAAVASGAWCIAAATEITIKSVRAERLLDERWIVEDADKLGEVVRFMLAERQGD